VKKMRPSDERRERGRLTCNRLPIGVLGCVARSRQGRRRSRPGSQSEPLTPPASVTEGAVVYSRGGREPVKNWPCALRKEYGRALLSALTCALVERTLDAAHPATMLSIVWVHGENAQIPRARAKMRS